MRNAFTLLTGLLALGCAACSTTPNLPASSAVQSDNDAYFVIGVSPAETFVDVRGGVIENGEFSARAQFDFHLNPYLNKAQDGFVVGKAGRGGEILAIVAVGTTGPSYSPCHGARTLVFTAPAGKVVYLGNVRYAFPTGMGGEVSTSYGDDIDAARAYLKTHYPQLADKLEHGTAQHLPTDETCMGIP